MCQPLGRTRSCRYPLRIRFRPPPPPSIQQQTWHWRSQAGRYQLFGVDVVAAQGSFSIVALGDSITNGHASITNGNDRWTDVLACRIQSAGFRNIGVLNEGIGGNHLLTNGLGPSALARFDRDVIAQTAVRDVIVLYAAMANAIPLSVLRVQERRYSDDRWR